MSHQTPIVVDLDGTLIKTDILWESLLLLAKQKPLKFMMSPFWLLGGKSFLKKRLAEHVMPDVSVLPYFDELIAFLRKSKEEGKKLIIASATDERIVKEVANYLELFDTVLGTSDGNNLKGKHKMELIKSVCDGKGFDYVGNDRADIPIWKASEKAYVVTNSKKLINAIPKKPNEIHVFKSQRSLKAFIKALRPHQWIKNILLFIPLFLAHELTSVDKIITILLAFVSMSLCASSVYIINDLFDLEADRYHPSKKKRPFADGLLSIPSGLVMAFTLLLASFSTSFMLLPQQFTVVLTLYLVLTTIYSLLLKERLLLDVIGLSVLYTVRIFAGGVAVSVALSPWLLAFSSFFFLNLAFIKRYVELKESEFRNDKKLKGRDYHINDMVIIQSSGIASGYMSVLIFFLYITNSREVIELYSNPMWLWFIGPLLIYWLTRIWLLAQRRCVDSDPVLFAVKDFQSWVIGFGILSMILLGSLL